MALPGVISSIPHYMVGTKCTDHPELDAVSMLCTESDSMGDEWQYMCAACNSSYRLHRDRRQGLEGNCDRCGNHAKLRHWRDLSEGMSGRIYQVCDACRIKGDAEFMDEEDDID